MGAPGTPEASNGIPEGPLTLQVAKEAQTMISKLKELKLDESSAPGMSVFGDNGNQIAILYGRMPIQETTPGQREIVTKEKHLVISPKGFFLAEGQSDIQPNDEALNSTLRSIRKNGQDVPPNVSFDEYGRLKIDTNGMHQAFKLTRIDSTPEQFAEMLKLAIEKSRQIGQKPLLEELARGKAANDLLTRMIQTESQPSSGPLQPPPSSSTA